MHILATGQIGTTFVNNDPFRDTVVAKSASGKGRCGSLIAPLRQHEVEGRRSTPLRGINVGYETVRFWWNQVGPLFVSQIRKRRNTDPSEPFKLKMAS